MIRKGAWHHFMRKLIQCVTSCRLSIRRCFSCCVFGIALLHCERNITYIMCSYYELSQLFLVQSMNRTIQGKPCQRFQLRKANVEMSFDMDTVKKRQAFRVFRKVRNNWLIEVSSSQWLKCIGRLKYFNFNFLIKNISIYHILPEKIKELNAYTSVVDFKSTQVMILTTNDFTPVDYWTGAGGDGRKLRFCFNDLKWQ